MYYYESDDFKTKLTRRDILRLLEELEPYKEGLIIGFKGALVLYGACDKCNDVDITCSPTVARQLKKKYKVIGKSKFNGKARIEINERVEVFEDDNFNKLKAKAEKVDGFYLMDFQTIYERYKFLNRPKDQKTMKQIKAFCKKHNIEINITERMDDKMDTFVDLMYDMILESLSNYVESGELDIDEAEIISEAAYDELYYEGSTRKYTNYAGGHGQAKLQSNSDLSIALEYLKYGQPIPKELKHVENAARKKFSIMQQLKK